GVARCSIAHQLTEPHQLRSMIVMLGIGDTADTDLRRPEVARRTASDPLLSSTRCARFEQQPARHTSRCTSFTRKASTDTSNVIVRHSSRENLPCKSKRVCRDSLFLPYDLENFWRRVRGSGSYDPMDVRCPLQMWDNLLQKFHLLGEQAEIRNSCDVSFRPREAGYETEPNWLKCGKHDDRDGRRLLL